MYGEKGKTKDIELHEDGAFEAGKTDEFDNVSETQKSKNSNITVHSIHIVKWNFGVVQWFIYIAGDGLGYRLRF